ncbi:mitochondrial import receptor subunit TOM22 homolog [Bolinopsis microptera]|uniref:mitochondrial import receptor subunit TOM22 homolog n=1 Tax=Bolinopsis microptera TaxID=2820187 RepID=UPI003079FE69
MAAPPAMIEDVDDLDLIPDEELEETYLERIIGLREMFPRSARTGGAFVATTTKTSSLWLYHFIKSAIWITTTSAIIMALPVAIEITQIQAADDMKKVRQEKLFAK